MNKPWLLITGGAQRVGAFLNKAMAKQGYNIVLHYHHSAQTATRLKQELIERGAEVVLWQANLADPEQLTSQFEQLLTQIPQLDVLINSASIFQLNNIENASLTAITDNLHIHLTSPWLLTQRLMKQATRANIINITDANICHNYTTKAPYFIAKKALANFTELAAIECAPTIRVNAIAPGFVLDAIDASEAKPTSAINVMQQQVPLDNILTAVLFLISNTSITGETINIDGGSHLQCPSYMLKN